MSYETLLSQEVSVIRRSAGAVDVYGNPTESEAAAITYRGLLQQSSSRELTDDRDTQIAEWRLFLPAGAEVDGFDRVVVDGQTYEVVGPPEQVRTPRGVHHVEARCRWLSE